MASGKRSKADTVTYGDHEVITPDTAKLRKTLRAALPGEADPIERAEAALAAISGDFSNWMQDECARLDSARRKVRELGLSVKTRQELFLAAHDLKGDSGTLGYPEVMAAAESLCRLLEHTPDLTKIPLAIVDQHVGLVRRADDLEQIFQLRRVARPEARAIAPRRAAASLVKLRRAARDRERGVERGDLERWKHQRDGKRPRPLAEERFVQIRIERGELLVGRLLGQLRVRPEALERAVFRRIRGHLREVLA